MKNKRSALPLLLISLTAIIFLAAVTYLALHSTNTIFKETETVYNRIAETSEYTESLESDSFRIRELKNSLSSQISVLCAISIVTLLIITSVCTVKSTDLFAKIKGRAKVHPAHINSTINSLDSSANYLCKSVENLKHNADSQITALQNILGDVEICAYQTEMDGKNATIVGNVSREAKNEIATCNEEMTQMLSAIEGIKESSSNISKIIKIIDDIAMQTNLLSLNAAVEAVHGGEYGKGFAVVAGEVGNLALKSQKAVSDTTILINESLERVAAGTDIAAKTANSLSKIVDRVNKIYDLMMEINNSTDIQAQAFARVNTGIDTMSASVKNDSATLMKNTSVSEKIAEHCNFIKNVLSE